MKEALQRRVSDYQRIILCGPTEKNECKNKKNAAYLPVFLLFVEEHVANDLELEELISRDLGDQDQVNEGLTRTSVFIALKSPSASPIVSVRSKPLRRIFPPDQRSNVELTCVLFFIGSHIPYDNSLWVIQKRAKREERRTL